MSVMYVHISWFAVLLRKINPWLLPGKINPWLLRIRNHWRLLGIKILDDFSGDMGILHVLKLEYWQKSVVRIMPCTAWVVCLGNPENFDDLCWELRMRIFILLGSNENSDDFCGELRMRILILLGSNENSVGKKAYCWEVGSGVWIVCHSTGELSEVVVWLVFRLQNNLLGNLEKLDGFRWGLIVRKFWLRWGLGVWSFNSDGD